MPSRSPHRSACQGACLLSSAALEMPKSLSGPGNGTEASSSPDQVAATLTLPFDVVKTQRQMSLGAVEAVRGKLGLARWGRAGRA